MFTGLGTTGEGYGLQETRIWGHYFFGGWGLGYGLVPKG